jgi:putative oxidoreductase
VNRERLLHFVVRLFVGATFLYAGVVKIADPVGFAGSIAAYRIIPYFTSYLVAAVLPWLELLCGLLLVTGFRQRAAAFLLLFLDLVFIAALVSVIARGLDIDCGCFRAGGVKESPWAALGRDLLILVGLVVILKGGRRRGGQ